MVKQKIKIELLAPAKDKETAIIAIKSGADAVYLGYLKYGARSSVGNSIEDIKEVVDFAHIYRAKVYVTLNTILKDEELDKAVKVIYKLYSINVDGIIIQDMGLLECDLPPIPIIASTQCNNDSLEKIQFLDKTGFKRVILPREFSIDEIKNISKNTNVELESFVQGALCVSYSGQCYLSQAIGGRSANRGECAQPCRKKYSLVDSTGKVLVKDKYLLSLKDLNLSSNLKDLLLAGITSFKIEGRLKDKAYIKNVVSFYRKEIDKVLNELSLEKVSVGESIIDFEPNLDKTFNRGFTDYFITGKSKDLCTYDYSKSIGEFIGSVTKIKDKSFTLDKGELNNGDGICFLDSNDELRGTNINSIKDGFVYPQDISEITKGIRIYRNYDAKFISKLEKSHIERKIPVVISVFEEKNSFIFKINDEEGNEVLCTIENNFDKAKNIDKAESNLKKQLSKMGDTEFIVGEFLVDMQELPFIPISELNAIRRKLVEMFRHERVNNYHKNIRKNDINIVDYPIKKLTYKLNVYNEKAKSFYLKRGVESIEPAFETFKRSDDRIVMATKYCVKNLLGICSKNNNNHKYKEPFYLIDEFNKKYELFFDCSKCLMQVKF